MPGCPAPDEVRCPGNQPGSGGWKRSEGFDCQCNLGVTGNGVACSPATCCVTGVSGFADQGSFHCNCGTPSNGQSCADWAAATYTDLKWVATVPSCPP